MGLEPLALGGRQEAVDVGRQDFRFGAHAQVCCVEGVDPYS